MIKTIGNSDVAILRVNSLQRLDLSAASDLTSFTAGGWRHLYGCAIDRDSEKISRDAEKAWWPSMRQLAVQAKCELPGVGELDGAMAFLDHAGCGRTVRLIDVSVRRIRGASFPARAGGDGFGRAITLACRRMPHRDTFSRRDATAMEIEKSDDSLLSAWRRSFTHRWATGDALRDGLAVSRCLRG